MGVECERWSEGWRSNRWEVNVGGECWRGEQKGLKVEEREEKLEVRKRE